MQLLKQSTVATTTIGPILDAGGAVATGAVIGDLSISKNGGAYSAMAATATLTHVANGYYLLAFTVGNTDTLGRLDIICNNTSYGMTTARFQVRLSSVYEAEVNNVLTATGGLLDLNAIADALLTRNVSNVEATAGEHTLCTIILAMLENSISGGTLTIKRTDGSTTHYTKTLTSDAGAAPITGIA